MIRFMTSQIWFLCPAKIRLARAFTKSDPGIHCLYEEYDNFSYIKHATINLIRGDGGIQVASAICWTNLSSHPWRPVGSSPN